MRVLLADDVADAVVVGVVVFVVGARVLAMIRSYISS